MNSKKTRPTNALEKLFSSVINVAIVIFLWLPFCLIVESSLWQKLSLVVLFFLYNLFFLLFYKNRCLGMVFMGTYYKGKYVQKTHLIYDMLYTMSFSTILFSVFFPFDVLLFNILLVQLPTVLITKTTLHGYIAGNVATITK